MQIIPYQFFRRKLKNLNKYLKAKVLQKLPASTNPTATDNKNVWLAYTLEAVPTKLNTKIVGDNWLINFKGNEQSEHGEDGIIKQIFKILPPENKWVCEFGAHDPEIISNTWRLINNDDWNAVLIEGDSHFAGKLKSYYKKNPKIHCIHSLVSFEGNNTLDNILKSTSIPENLDFMVIDIDGCDYHIWKAIEKYRAKVVMVEFNASIPTDIFYVQVRDLTVNQGNSLKALTELATERDYKLIAVTAWNAFFVQDEYYHLFFDRVPLLKDMYVHPAKHPIWMRPFQLYDGTILVAPWNEMLWHKIDLKVNDYQMLPESLRFFSRELMEKNYYTKIQDEKNHENKISAIKSELPGNILFKFSKNVYSQYGEDGIIEALLPALSCENQYFIEIGAGDGVTFSRSRNLVTTHLWDGLQIESDEKLLLKLKKNNANKVKIHDSAVQLTGEVTINSILKSHQVPKQPSILFLNMYGMEYYYWEALTHYVPKLIVVQFNPTIPNDVKFIQAKDDTVHQGCSLRALCDLAHYKNYELVATAVETAFFVHRKHFYRLFELYGLQYADLDEMFAPLLMKWYQLYDGTIVQDGLDSLMWHGIPLDKEKLQVVPKALRQFHQFANKETKKNFYRV